MNGFIINLEVASQDNSFFRKVLYTTKNTQLVLMSLKPKEEIGEEVHHLDQFLRVESGEGLAVLDGKQTPIKDGDGIVVPAGARHNIINTSAKNPMKLYTVYAPPDHRDQTVHETKEDAMNDKHDEFDGKTTE